MQRHNTQITGAAKDTGVIKPIDYSIFQNHGYMGLYGGLRQQDIHKRKGLKKSQKILDHMSSTELALILGYTDYRNFEAVVEKAKLSCFNSGHRIEDYFADVSKMIATYPLVSG